MISNNQSRSAAQTAPDRRLGFERLLADLSARLVVLPPERVDVEIRNSLKEILEFFQIDRCNLMRLLPGKTHFIVTHNADVNSISPYPLGTPGPVSLFPWVSQKLQKGEVISFARSQDLPEEAATDKPAIEKFGIRSGLYIPNAALSSTEYSLGISSAMEDRTCPGEYIARLLA